MNKFKVILIVYTVMLLYESCAKIGSPAGGPKDEISPVVVATIPENYSTGYNQGRIEIEFDEFILLKNINQELVVSPPMETKPVIRIRKKSIIIELEEQPRDNTTYTLNFGQAIVDNNEGNLLENYEFIFSSGDYIDSLAVSGVILNAFDMQPSKEPVYVMLYIVDNDSVPYNEIPLYIGKASEKGSFLINNIKPDTFKVFALKDGNFNFLYDLPDEMIAFMDTTFILSAELISEFLDSIQLLKDTLTVDSQLIDDNNNAGIDLPDSIPDRQKSRYSLTFDLFMFQEDRVPQYLKDYKRSNPRKIEFYFNRPIVDTLVIEPLNFDHDANWFIYEKFIIGDTLVYWIKDSLIYKQDTLKLHLHYRVTDSVLNYVPFDDTLSVVITQMVSKSKKQKKEEEGKDEILELSLNIRKGGTHDIYRKIIINPNHPVAFIDQSKINLFMKEDKEEHLQKFNVAHDSLYLRRYFLDHSWEEAMNYRLFIEPGAFTDIYGLINDTIDISFKTQSLDNYGKIVLTMEHVNRQVIIELMNEKEQVIRNKISDKDSTVEFSYLAPGKYKLKLVFDNNRNGKWDTGIYLLKIQPERVIYYPETVEVRSNWDLELKWDLEGKY